MKLKVIGAGFGRTGTQSLQEALNTLGYSCFHTKLLATPTLDFLRLWNELGDRALEVETDDHLHLDFNFDLLFGEYGFDATVDFPSCMFYEYLMEAYPEAKVILSVRDDGEQWYQSVKRKSLAFHPSILPAGGTKLFYHYNPLGIFIYGMLNKTYMRHFQDVNDKEAIIAQYHQWNNDVINTVPPDKLLVFNVKEGWAPLCEFLDVPSAECPTGAFPRSDDVAPYLDGIVPLMGYLTFLMPLFMLTTFLVWILRPILTSLQKNPKNRKRKSD